ncbi:hypothetical protein OROGR_027590 [Orobanche gracilis]
MDNQYNYDNDSNIGKLDLGLDLQGNNGENSPINDD